MTTILRGMQTSSANDRFELSTSSVPGTASRWLTRILATDGDVRSTIARVALGLVMLPHGLQKTLGWFGGHGFSGTYGFFTGSMGVPGPLAVAAILAESLGALALIAGVGSRVAALGVAAVMAVAIGTVHLGHGFFMNWTGAQGGEGFEYHLLALALAAIVVVKGGGKASVDRLLAAKR